MSDCYIDGFFIAAKKGGKELVERPAGVKTKLMAMADNHNSLPIALYCTSATPHEVTLAKKTITKCITKRYPKF